MANKKILSVVTNLILFVVVSFCLVAGFTLSNSNKISSVNATNADGVIYAGNKEGNNVALMINVYWGTEFLDDMLEVLKQYNAKCTFFVGGSWAASNQNMLNKIVSMGHELGNHGYYHKDHAKLDASRNREEIKITHDLIYTCMNGLAMNLFAPPGGSYNKTTIQVASELGYKTIMWTRDTIDWRDKDEGLIYNRAVTNMAGGDLILMHPTEKTLTALPKILDYIKANGFIANTVTATIN